MKNRQQIILSGDSNQIPWKSLIVKWPLQAAIQKWPSVDAAAHRHSSAWSYLEKTPTLIRCSTYCSLFPSWSFRESSRHCLFPGWASPHSRNCRSCHGCLWTSWALLLVIVCKGVFFLLKLLLVFQGSGVEVSWYSPYLCGLALQANLPLTTHFPLWQSDPPFG